MDKRWIGILLILIAGLGCMYLIVNNSTSVGNAVTVISDATVVLPTEFKILDTSANEAKLLDEDHNRSVKITCLKDDKNPQKEFSKTLLSYENKHDVEIKNNITNDTLSLLELQDINTGENTSFILFEKIGHSFIMKMDNYENSDDLQKDAMFFINHIKFDYKQNKG